MFDVVHMFSEQGISAVPIVDENGKVLNLYETVDVIVSVLATHWASGVRTALTITVLDPRPEWGLPVT